MLNPVIAKISPAWVLVLGCLALALGGRHLARRLQEGAITRRERLLLLAHCAATVASAGVGLTALTGYMQWSSPVCFLEYDWRSIERMLGFASLAGPLSASLLWMLAGDGAAILVRASPRAIGSLGRNRPEAVLSVRILSTVLLVLIVLTFTETPLAPSATRVCSLSVDAG